MSSTMDNKLKLCIAICDKLPPEEATAFSNASAVSITPEQDQQLLHHTAILRLQRLLKTIPKTTHSYYLETIEAIQDTIAYHQKADTSLVAQLTAESNARGAIPNALQKDHGRPCWSALHSSWTSVQHPHISHKYAAICHQFSAIINNFTNGIEEQLNEYRQSATDVLQFLNIQQPIHAPMCHILEQLQKLNT